MKSIHGAVILLFLLVSAPLFADSTDTKSTTESVTVVEEELSLEEELELIDTDLLVTEEVKKDTVALEDSLESVSGDSAVEDTTEIKRGGPSSGATSFTSKTGRKSSGSDSTAAEDSTTEEEFSLSDIEIDNAGTVDLDKNVKEYRSPRRAMLYSLAVPGWGQAYTKKTWKSVLFGALEVGVIVGAVKFKKDGEDKVKEAHALADANFSKTQLKERLDATVALYHQNFTGFDDTLAEYTLMQFISGNTYSRVDSAVKSFDVESSFYDRDFGVGSHVATLGWTDNALTAGVTTFNQDTITSITSVDLGHSAMQLQYNSMLAKADDYAGYKQAFIVGIFTNHVASAIDAFITARRYNRKLLAMKNQTAYRKRIIDNIHIDNDLAFSARTGVVTKVGFKWNF